MRGALRAAAQLVARRSLLGSASPGVALHVARVAHRLDSRAARRAVRAGDCPLSQSAVVGEQGLLDYMRDRILASQEEEAR